MYRPGPYSVGEPWSLIANVIMLSWTTFACVILCVVRHPFCSRPVVSPQS